MSRPVCATLLLLAAQGCFHPTPPQVWHVLQPLSSGPPAAPRPALALEVLPVRVPESLQRPQLVLATGPGTLEVNEAHRWANGLEGDLQRVLAENLVRLTGSDQVVAAPGAAAVKARLRLEVEVQQCEGRPGGTLTFRATWGVVGADRTPMVRRRFQADVPAPGKDIAGLVQAHGTALGLLARDIAQGLAALP